MLTRDEYWIKHHAYYNPPSSPFSAGSYEYFCYGWEAALKSSGAPAVQTCNSQSRTICADFGGDNTMCVWGGKLTCGATACKFVKRKHAGI